MSERARVDPVWRHAPTVLLRFPTLFVGIAFGALLLALAAAAYPLFLSATTSSLVRAGIDRENITRYGAGLTYRFTGMPLEPRPVFDFRNNHLDSPDPARVGSAFAAMTGEEPVLGPPVETVLDDIVSVSTPGSDESRDGRLFSGTDVLDHVELLRGHEGPGVWVPDLLADALGIRAGDEIELTEQDGHSTKVGVDGIYRAVYTIYDRPNDGYWLPWQEDFAVPCGDCSPPAQPILGDRSQVLSLAEDLHQDSATMQWNAPIADPSAVSLQDIAQLQHFTREAIARASDQQDPLGRLFQCCRNFFFLNTGTNMTSSIGYVISDVNERAAAVEGPTRVLEIAGLAVALSVVAAAGAFSVRARRVEAAWLFARGSSSVSVGVKTALESLLPVVAGTAAGIAAAWTAVTALGPDAPIASQALTDALVASGIAVAGAVVLGSIAASVTYVRVVDPHGRRFARVAKVIPWELVLAALAFLAYRRLQHGGAFVTDPTTHVTTPSLTLVAFPFLLFATFAAIGARIARLAFGWLRSATARANPAPYLAARRLAAGDLFTMLLVGAASLCLATLFNAQIVARSLETTVDAKAGVFVGSDVQGRIDYSTPLPRTFPLPTTRVVKIGSGVKLPNGRGLDLLAIDASTFADAAFWNGAFADESIEDLTSQLTHVEDGRLPIVVAGGGDLPVDRLAVGTTEVPVDVVAHASAFPGMSTVRPLVVGDAQTLIDVADLPFDPLHSPTGSTELWVRGPTHEAVAELANLEYPPTSVLTAAEVKDIPYISAAIDTFLVVNVLGVIAAALVFVGMLMYLQGRQRSQVVSYAISIRMGMPHRQHRLALVLELGAMLAWGVVIGVVLALVAARLTVPRLDPIGTIPPDPILVTPVLSFAIAAAIIGALAWLGAAWTVRRVRSVDVAEVMRVAE